MTAVAPRNADERADHLARRALDPLGPVGSQAAAHAVNLGAQALLAAVFGAEIYGALGLALLIAATLCFLGEMGYPTLFLREAASRSDWLAAWRRALGRRAVGLAAAAAAAVVWRAATGGWDDPGTRALLAAAPGIVASAFAPTPILYGLRASRQAAATVYLRWAAYGAAVLTVAAFCSAENVGLWTGAAFSIGMLAQIAVVFWPGFAPAIPAAAFTPSFAPPAFDACAASAFDAGARRMWIMACLGAAHSRALLFLVETAAPSLLAPALFAHQALQGLAGLFCQLDRVTLPELANCGDDSAAPMRRRAAARLVLGPSAAAGPALAALALAAAPFYPSGWGLTGSAAPFVVALGGFFLLEWQLQMIGAAMNPIILAKRREAALCVVFLRVAPVGLIVQTGLAAVGWFFPALAVRVAVVAAVAAWSVRLADAETPRSALVSAAATAVGCVGALIWAAVERGL